MTDLVLRDRLTGVPLYVLPAAPVSGYLTVTLNEKLWRSDRVTVEMDARVAIEAGVLKGRLLQVQGLIFLVEQVHVATDEKSRVSALATVTGYDPVSVPRSLQPVAGQSHDVQSDVTGETAMKHYVDRNIGSSATSSRKWALLSVEPDQGRGLTGEWRARYQQLEDFLGLIGQETGIGTQTFWNEIPVEDFTHGRAEFRVVDGQHRDRLLAIAEGTARSEELLTTDSDLLTYTYVAGQGEGAARTIVERFLGDIEPTELLRREVFVDARDTDAVPTLESRGDAKLAETQQPDAVEVEVHEFDGWRYGVDFALGDTLNYRSPFLVSDRTVRIVEVATVWRESLATPDRMITLDRPFPEPDENIRISGGTQFE